MSDRVLYEINQTQTGMWQVLQPFSARLRDFLTARHTEIAARSVPIALEPGPAAVLHFIPNDALDGTISIDMKVFAGGCPELCPIAASGWNNRYNADGFLAETPALEGKVSGYAQLLRSGIVEAATTDVFGKQGDSTFIASLLFENEIINAVERCISLAIRLGCLFPHTVCISLIDVKGVQMATDSSRYRYGGGRQIDRKLLQALPVTLSSQPLVASELRPAFDYFWQAAGWAGSHYYLRDGSRGR